MSDTVAPAYKKPWVVDSQPELDILTTLAEGHGFKIKIVAIEGEGFGIGGAECEIYKGQFGVLVLGNKPVDPSDDIDFYHEVDDAWQEHRRTSAGTKEAPAI